MWREAMRLPRAFVAACLVLHVQVARASRGVLEGDTGLELYVNGYYMFADPVMPVLLMNSERRFNVGSDGAWPVVTNLPLAPGDVVALKGFTSRPEFVPVTLPNLLVVKYAGLGGVIAAFDDGTITNSDWRCTEWIPEYDQESWYLANYDDSMWPNAVEQPRDCCPWRDPLHKWKRLSAQWIGPPRANASGPREFYCRYSLPNGTAGMMDGSDLTASSFLDGAVTISNFQVARAHTVIFLNVRQELFVTCGLVDARFELRAPTPVELRSWGTTALVRPTTATWEDVTGLNKYREYKMPALEVSRLADISECRTKCIAHVNCTAISFLEEGLEGQSASYANCQLFAVLDATQLGDPPHQTFGYRHLEQKFDDPQLALTDTLLNFGTLYNAYCMASENTGNGTMGFHSTWSALAATKQTARTKGCFNCGGRQLPEVQILGGFSTNNTITAIVRSSIAGRVLCAAQQVGNDSPPMSSQDVIAVGSFQLIIVDGVSVPVPVADLEPGTEYDVSCVAESEEGAVSSEENLQDARRRWHTDLAPSTVENMVIQQRVTGSMELRLETAVRVNEQGLLYCQVYNESTVQMEGVPTASTLSTTGFRQEVDDVRVDALGMFPGLDPEVSYEVYCTAKYIDLAALRQNETFLEMLTATPKATIVRTEVDYDEVRLKVLVQYGPARVYCQAQQWGIRPYSSRPPVPDASRMKASPWNEIVDTEFNALIAITVGDLPTGSWIDVYCYAEELLPEPPPGVAPPAAKGMKPDEMRQRRVLIRTPGPEFKEDGWRCVAGSPCGISGLRGWGLSPFDQLLARSRPCPGRCQCGGIEDVDLKGAVCSEVSHSRTVHHPDANNNSFVDEKDPRGPWCYVNKGTCADEESSPTFPSMLISYFACFFDAPVNRPGLEPSGFLNEGLATQVNGTHALDGTAFSWGKTPLIVPGAGYHLCWCNGTTSSCLYERDFRLRIGLLHVAGPSRTQLGTQLRCWAGFPCTIEYFNGHATAAGNRLAVLPATPLGCAWEKDWHSAPPGPLGFPYWGLSEPAKDDGRVFSWGPQPVTSLGGIYLLCWCGSETTSGVSTCPSQRPLNGLGFLAPAGELQVVGPSILRTQICSFGVDCVIEDVVGSGLKGGDRVAILQECGKASQAPANWTAGAPGLGTFEARSGWTQGGWLTYVPQALVQTSTMPPNVTIPPPATPLLSFTTRAPTSSPTPSPAQVAPASAPPQIPTPAPMPTTTEAPTQEFLERFSSFGTFDGLPDHRGVWGFAHRGMSLSTPKVGHYSWESPSLALPGVYMLCWCPAVAVCEQPENYQMRFGSLRLRGPTALPFASQAFICIRGRACQLNGLLGFEVPPGSKLLVATEPCGGPPSAGMPGEGGADTGVSWPTVDGSSFSWGPTPVRAVPGKHRLCWCVGRCFQSSDFKSFAGVLRVKAPIDRPRRFFCALGELVCYIEGVDGEGLSPKDRVMVMSNCGEGIASANFADAATSVETGPDGSWFRLPPARAAGINRVCWCPAENLCVRGEDFYTDIGKLVVGGPEAFATYHCYEWRPCVIPELVGFGGALSDGDRLWVVPPGESCGNGESLGHDAGFPFHGLAYPATEDGRRHSWGSQKIRAEPGMYLLCWCSRWLAPNGICDESAPYLLRAGVLKVGSAKEYMYVNRPADPEARSDDSYYALMLAIILPIILLAVLVFARMKLTRTGGPVVPDPWEVQETQQQKQKNKAKAIAGYRELSALRHVMLARFAAKPTQGVQLEDIAEKTFFESASSPKRKETMGMLEDASPSKLSAIADSPASLSSLPWEVPEDPAAIEGPMSGQKHGHRGSAPLALAISTPESPKSPTSPLQRLKSAGHQLFGNSPPDEDAILKQRFGIARPTRRSPTLDEGHELIRVSVGDSRKRASRRRNKHRQRPASPQDPPPRLLGTGSPAAHKDSIESEESSDSSGPAPPPPEEAPPPPKWSPPMIPTDPTLRRILELDSGQQVGRLTPQFRPHRASSMARSTYREGRPHRASSMARSTYREEP